MSYRILRSIKNRYGSTSEICVFKMTHDGLEEVTNPSALMLEQHRNKLPGTCIACINKGSRTIFTEIQALVTKSNFGIPRRVSTGFDYNRLCLILAVLEKRAGFFFYEMDVYVNVVGGIKLEDTSYDLPLALSLISALKNDAVTEDTIAFGEIGLTGEVRNIQGALENLKESENLGFKSAITPIIADKSKINTVKITEIKNVKEIKKLFWK